jgi:hypothetical protein
VEQMMMINMMVEAMVMIKCFRLGKEEREKQNWAQGKGDIYRAILFW